MITTSKWLGLLAVAFVAGSFVASPELRAYAAATIGSADIIDESIQSVDIKNGQVKAADIATDAVTADEIKGVSKLLFGQCNANDATPTSASEGGVVVAFCTVSGADTDDSVIATLNGNTNNCFDTGRAWVQSSNNVAVPIRNNCPDSLGSIPFADGSTIAVIVFDK